MMTVAAAAAAAMLRAAATMTAIMTLFLVSTQQAEAEDTPSPNDAIPKPECDANATAVLRYSSSSERLYLESADGVTRGGCITLTEIWQQLAGSVPLFAVESESGNVSRTATGTWLLTETLYVEDGITLQVHGTSAGGDADELRLLSTNGTYINLRGYGGSLDFVSTKVFAWDTAINAVDQDEEDGRSYISAISEVITDETQACDGRAKSNMGEARMDIEDSEMAYLGFHDGESYGLTWKVRGFCKDLSNPEVFDDVNVYGNIYDSDIHHNRFGVYTYGHQQGDWRRNKMHDNAAYGFDPHDDSDFLTIHDNEVYDNVDHGIIASKRCNGASIQGNEVYGGGEESVGIFLHRSGDDAIVKGNYVHDNGDAGIALMESFNAEVSGNVFAGNKYGIRLSVGCGDSVFSDNVMTDSTRYNVFIYKGSDDPWVTDSGRSRDNHFEGNTLIGGIESIKVATADRTTFRDNTFQDVIKIRFENSTATVMSNNTGLDGVELRVTEGACFDGASDAAFVPVC